MQHPSRSRGPAALAVLATAALALAGCSAADGADVAAAPVKNGAAQVAVTLSESKGCSLSDDSAKAGPVTFTVTNKDATAITEVELLSGQRIVGEKENLAPGLDPVSFTVTLGGGTYQLYCPGADTEKTAFTVTGKAVQAKGSASTLLADGTTGYGQYVDGVVDAMVQSVTTLKSDIDSGDVAASQKQYALARPFYEKIESDVDGFVLPGFDATDNKGNLDYLIDMRESNLDPAVGWHGFHAIEKDLFQGQAITDSTKALAAELLQNVTKLDTVVKTLKYKPEDLANGAADLLEEVQSNKVTGEEEAYSHIDIVDFAGNVEGAQQAFAYLKPGLTKIDSTLTTQVAAQFDKVDAMLDGYRDDSALGGYRQYTDALKASDAATMSRTVQALQEPLSKIAEKVATAG